MSVVIWKCSYATERGLCDLEDTLTAEQFNEKVLPDHIYNLNAKQVASLGKYL